MSFSGRKLALMGVLVALAIVLKLPILTIPNVEFFTFIIFCSGYLLGMTGGVMVGVISMSIYTTLITPYGPPPLPIAIAQIASMALIGFAGGFVSNFVPTSLTRKSQSRSVVAIIAIGISGLVLTLVYDLFTNLASAFVVGQFWPVMIAGIPFALVHIASNVVIFVVLSPLLLRMSKSLQSNINPSCS
jgi:energy-coupling factor transport system substrate-specific component